MCYLTKEDNLITVVQLVGRCYSASRSWVRTRGVAQNFLMLFQAVRRRRQIVLLISVVARTFRASLLPYFLMQYKCGGKSSPQHDTFKSHPQIQESEKSL